MFQLRGLGAIDQNNIGAGNSKPQIVEGGSIDVGPLTPPTMYPGQPPAPSGGGGGFFPLIMGTTYQRPLLMTQQPSPPMVNPSMPPPLPAPPYVNPGIPTNPSNPMQPAPGGTQVSYQPLPGVFEQAKGKIGWIALGLGILALGGALIAGHVHHHS